MNVLLVACLFSQLSYFEFTDNIPSPQVAGDVFLVSIVAKDASGQNYPWAGTALLLTSRDGIFNFASPSQLSFSSGMCQTWVKVMLATDSIKLKCMDPQTQAFGWSSSFAVFPNSPARYMTILPGESLAPGSPTGKYPNRPPQNQIAGDSFSMTTYVIDQWFNPIKLRNDSVYFGGTDPFGIYPAGRLQGGVGAFQATLRRAGTHRLYTRGVGTSIRGDTSSSFLVSAGPFSNLLVVLPGEALLAGDSTTQVFATPGKTGRPSALYVKDSVAIRVVATDRCWNRVLPTTDSIRLLSDFAFHANPFAGWLHDSTLFSGEFDSAGTNQTLWVHDYTHAPEIESYRCLVDVGQRTESIAITGLDTVRAGAIAVYHATLLDANAMPIAARTCQFAVTRGSGMVLDLVGISDTAGVTSVEFECDSAHFSEVDSIQFTADGFSKRKGVYIDIPGPGLDSGKVIAYPNPFGWEQPFTKIIYKLPRSCDVTVAIYDPFGNPVLLRKIPKGEQGAANGLNWISWDGKTDLGTKVASGLYILKLWGQEHTGIVFKKTYRLGVVW
jgi:hypothetical protein